MTKVTGETPSASLLPRYLTGVGGQSGEGNKEARPRRDAPARPIQLAYSTLPWEQPVSDVASGIVTRAWAAIGKVLPAAAAAGSVVFDSRPGLPANRTDETATVEEVMAWLGSPRRSGDRKTDLANMAAANAYIWAIGRYSPERVKDELMPKAVALAVARAVGTEPLRGNTLESLLDLLRTAEAAFRKGELQVPMYPVAPDPWRMPDAISPQGQGWWTLDGGAVVSARASAGNAGQPPFAGDGTLNAPHSGGPGPAQGGGAGEPQAIADLREQEDRINQNLAKLGGVMTALRPGAPVPDHLRDLVEGLADEAVKFRLAVEILDRAMPGNEALRPFRESADGIRKAMLLFRDRLAEAIPGWRKPALSELGLEILNGADAGRISAMRRGKEFPHSVRFLPEASLAGIYEIGVLPGSTGVTVRGEVDLGLLRRIARERGVEAGINEEEVDGVLVQRVYTGDERRLVVPDRGRLIVLAHPNGDREPYDQDMLILQRQYYARRDPKAEPELCKLKWGPGPEDVTIFGVYGIFLPAPGHR
jgi:hypothetical protein